MRLGCLERHLKITRRWKTRRRSFLLQISMLETPESGHYRSGAFIKRRLNWWKHLTSCRYSLPKQRKLKPLERHLWNRACAANIVLGAESWKELSQIFLSTSTLKRRIDEFVEGEKIKALVFFAIQYDDTIDETQCSQFLVYSRFVDDGAVKGEML